MSDGGVCRTAPARPGLFNIMAFNGMKLGHISYDCWSFEIYNYHILREAICIADLLKFRAW